MVWFIGSPYPQVVTAFVQNFSPPVVVDTTALIGAHPAGWAFGTLAVYEFATTPSISPVSHVPATLVAVEPPAVLAVTIGTRLCPLSADWTVYIELVAPLMAEHEAVVGGCADVVVQRSHW